MITTTPIPADRRGPSGPTGYKDRWRWWYASIADLMLMNPGIKLDEIARRLNKAYNTIHLITSSDTFREYFAQRRQAQQDDTDARLRKGLVGVAELGLEILAKKLEEKRTSLPMPLIQAAAMGALDRLGYAPKTGPSVVVDARTDNRSVNIAISSADLEQARETLRLAEAARMQQPLPSPQRQLLEATAIESEEGEADAPVSLSS